MTIADNKKAFFDYFIEDRYEAGIVLEGWEVKAIRDSRVQIKEAYVVVRGDELFLFGAHITPLSTVSTHFIPDPTRTRKLLLHQRELDKFDDQMVDITYAMKNSLKAGMTADDYSGTFLHVSSMSFTGFLVPLQARLVTGGDSPERHWPTRRWACWPTPPTT